MTVDVLLDADQVDGFELAFVRDTHEYDVRHDVPDFPLVGAARRGGARLPASFVVAGDATTASLLDALVGSDGARLLTAHGHLVSYFRVTDAFPAKQLRFHTSTCLCARAAALIWNRAVVSS